jgi:hypothetical protein
MMSWPRRFAVALFVSVAPLATGAAFDPAEADRVYQSKDWEAATKAYASLAKDAPKNPLYAFRWGASLHGLGRSAEALPLFEAAADLGLPRPLMQAWSARALTRMGQKDRALETLATAAAGGFAQIAMLDTETDFAPLRGDPRFEDAREATDRNARPCAFAPEHRQLDFWLGDWRVTSSGAPAGESRVERILESCVVFENWTGASGMSGKSFNVWDRTKKEWRQTWVDDKGTLTEFRGEFRGGNMYFTAESLQPGPDGKLQKTLQKMTFFDLGGQVRQLGEQSTDEGKTWTVAYDLVYSRRPAP